MESCFWEVLPQGELCKAVQSHGAVGAFVGLLLPALHSEHVKESPPSGAFGGLVWRSPAGPALRGHTLEAA